MRSFSAQDFAIVHPPAVHALSSDVDSARMPSPAPPRVSTFNYPVWLECEDEQLRQKLLSPLTDSGDEDPEASCWGGFSGC